MPLDTPITVIPATNNRENEEWAFLVSENVVLTVGVLCVTFPCKLNDLIAVFATSANVVDRLLIAHGGAIITLTVSVRDNDGVFAGDPTDDGICACLFQNTVKC